MFDLVQVGWDAGTVSTLLSGDKFAKTYQVESSEVWGGNFAVAAWENNPGNTIDASAYTHVRFKVQPNNFSQFEVVVKNAAGDTDQQTYQSTVKIWAMDGKPFRCRSLRTMTCLYLV